jgi:hypothetical protein
LNFFFGTDYLGDVVDQIPFVHLFPPFDLFPPDFFCLVLFAAGFFDLRRVTFVFFFGLPPSAIHLSIAALSNRQARPMLIEGIFSCAGCLQIVAGLTFK